MKLLIRRVGNSLGVIVPRTKLDSWGLGEGDHLHLSADSIRPARLGGFSHTELDDHKRRLAVAVVSACSANHIRAQSMANLQRWKANGVWGPAYEEWQRLLENAADGELFAVMLGRDERSNRLRQSPPYVGMLPRAQVEKLNEEAAS